MIEIVIPPNPEIKSTLIFCIVVDPDYSLPNFILAINTNRIVTVTDKRLGIVTLDFHTKAAGV